MKPDPLPFLYPSAEPDDCGHFEADQHRLWWEASGAANGIPLIFLHGGPGSPSRPVHRRFFDPAHYRFITLHQRGCGKSTPLAEAAGNTTAHLIEDIERLRRLLGVERWLVCGGSWGSKLGLVYGETFPERCLGFLFVGVTLGRKRDADWWWQGTRMLFPEAFDCLVTALPPELREDPQAGCYVQLMNPDPAIHLPIAKALCLFSAATVTITPSPDVLVSYEDPAVSLPLARLFLHYARNQHFLEPDQILRDLDRITHLPCAIVGGRYDVTTPIDAAWTLHKHWPGSTLTIVEDGAHGLSDPPMAHAFIEVARSIHRLLKSTRSNK